jgi:hypothetical protein
MIRNFVNTVFIGSSIPSNLPSQLLQGPQSAKFLIIYSKYYRNWAVLEHKIFQSIIIKTYWKSDPQIKYKKLGNVCIA